MASKSRPKKQADVPTWLPSVSLGLVAIVILVFAGGPLALFNGRLPYTGDFTGHDWWLITFRDALIHARALGWNSQINNGYLFGYTYFPLPPLIVAVLASVMPIALAIKLMVLGSLVSMPFGLGQLCKGLGFSRRIQSLAILCSPLALLCNHPVTIGGSLFDTLCGEFSMALAIGCGLCFLGELASITRGVGRWWVAGLWLSATILSHIQGTVAVVIVALCLVATSWRNRTIAQQGVGAVILAAGLSAWWWMPASSVSGETLGDVNPVYHSVTAFLLNSMSGFVVVAGVIGLGLGIWRRYFGANSLLIAVGVLAPTLLFPLKIFTAGRVYPIIFWLAVVGVAFALEEVWKLVAHRAEGNVITLAMVALTLVVSIAGPLSVIGNRQAAAVDPTTFAGVENFKGAASLRKLVTVLDSLPPGRVMAETPANFASQFGDWLWPNLLPLWTHGHDVSPSGLFVNATPSSIAIEYALGNLAPSVYYPVISWQPSPSPENPQAGINQLRALGVRYFVVMTPYLRGLFSSLHGVHLVAVAESPSQASAEETYSSKNTLNTFWVYQIDHSETVTGITSLSPMSALATKPYVLSMTQYLDQVGSDTSAATPVVNLKSAYRGPIATVSNVSLSDQRISFHVDHVREPVIVRESYSPLWHVTGGRLYQAEPNEMLVWPTSTSVTMTFTPPVTQTIGLGVTVLSVIGLLYLVATDLRRRREVPSA